MSFRRLFGCVFFSILLAFLTISPSGSTSQNTENSTLQATALIAGRNVNMVSGTTLPGGDPWLQRQNEPSIAVSTRNPLHLLAGANDYRTVDMPASEGELPGIVGVAGGDAWLGVYKSFNGGESWATTLLPGFPQDLGAASPLKGYTTAADPIVRAGTNGIFYYSGLAFNRVSPRLSALFVARYIDNNNSEKTDPIKYLDTKILDTGNEGQFIDMPTMAVDIPRVSGTVTIDGQSIPKNSVYLAYSVFPGNLAQNVRSNLYFVSSADSGQSWGKPTKISESSHINQGTKIAIDPESGAIYVAWRRFAHGGDKDAILVVKSTDKGKTFSKPAVISNINPFDQPATDAGVGVGDPAGTSFRTNSYPTMTVDDQGIVYVAWSERGKGPGGEARIVISASQGGTSFYASKLVEPLNESNSHRGHQVMPFLTFAAGKLMAVWYDQRESAGAHYYNSWDIWISDGLQIRQTVDIRAAQAAPSLYPTFQGSVQVSRYLWVLDNNSGMPVQGQYNPPNYPLFKGGTVPFHGDYVEITPAPMFVLDANGSWRYNTDSSTTPVFHVAWTDNRDVRPPSNNDWTAYTPPGKGGCAPANTGMRNQNIYTSRLTNELVVAAPGNAKPLGTALGYYPSDLGGGLIQRAFAIYVKNPAGQIKYIRLKIIQQPSNGSASFLEFEPLKELDVAIAPYSTIARTVYMRSMIVNDMAKIEVFEIDSIGGSRKSGGLSAVVVLNPDPTNPTIPAGTPETRNPNIVNPNIVNWTTVNPNIINPNIVNPGIPNPNIVNPNIVNPNIVNPNIVNPNIVNPNIVNPNIVNPNIVNPNIVNPNMSDGAKVSDVMCTVKNGGNTTSAYTLKTFSKEAFPEGIYLQLLVYKANYTPAAPKADGTDCSLQQERHHELLLNVANPNIVNPNIVNPNIVNPNIVNSAIENASFSLAPGEEAEVCLRVVDTSPQTAKVLSTGQVFNMGTFLGSIGFATTGHAVNTEDAQNGIVTPPATASKLVIGTSSLPDGYVGQSPSYNASLMAYGGEKPYSWSLTSGQLPPGLTQYQGVISGTPTAAGTYYFIVRVDDSSITGQFDTQRYSITINQTSTPGLPTITTTSLPNSILGYWYGATLEATGGKWPRTWSLASGTLPPGLSLDSGGVISGTPSSLGNSNFTVRVRDANGSYDDQSLIITISAFSGSFFTISGTVYNDQGQPLSGVVMRGLPNTPVTKANGNYEDKVPQNWTGTVIPSKSGYTFNPASRSYPNIQANMLNEDYNKPLTVTNFDPADGVTYVALDADLKITFNENVQRVTGNIVIMKSADDSVFETIGVTSGQITISNNVVTINPVNTFATLTDYYVQIAATCFRNLSGNYYAGISDKTTWNFITAPDLVAYYPFSGNANDESGNANHGTVHGAVLTDDRFGNTNSAYSFDGVDDYIEAQYPDFNITDAITIVAWVKPVVNNIELPIVNKYRSAVGFRAYWLYGWTLGEPGPWFRVCTPPPDENVGDAYVNELLPTASWSFIVATYDGSEVKLYINGTLKYTGAFSGKINTNSLPLRIGADNESTPAYFKGKIDDVRIYKRALSASEIQALYAYESSHNFQVDAVINIGEQALIAGDLRNDGIQRIVSGNYQYNGDGYIRVYSYADGNYEQEWSKLIQENYKGRIIPVAVGDVNNDGKNEFLINVFQMNKLQIYQWSGSTYEMILEQSIGNDYAPAAVFDLDRDGLNELVIDDVGGISVYKYQKSSLVKVWAAGEGHCLQIAIGDPDGDGEKEVVAFLPWASPGKILVIGYDDLSYAIEATIQDFPLGGLGGGAVADFDKDGKQEIITSLFNVSATEYPIYLVKYVNGNYVVQTIYSASMGMFQIHAGDIDGDGYPEASILRNRSGSFVVEYRSGSYYVLEVVHAGPGIFGDVADVDGDGKPEILSGETGIIIISDR